MVNGGHFEKMLIMTLRPGRFCLILDMMLLDRYVIQWNQETFCCNLFDVPGYFGLFSPPIIIMGLYYFPWKIDSCPIIILNIVENTLMS